MRPTFLSAAFLVAGSGASALHIYPRQGFFSTLRTIFGGGDDDDDDSTPVRPGRPTRTSTTAAAAATTRPPVTTTDRATMIITTTISPSKPMTSSMSSAPSTTSNTSTSTSTPTLTTTAQPTSASTASTLAPTSTALSSEPRPTSPNSSGGISSAGIAVAAIFSIVIVLIIAWLIFRYNPRCRAWWLARQKEKYQKRSYRDAIDGPHASESGAGGMTRNRSTLQSFFAPRTARLGGGREIKRKTVNWGAPRRGASEVDTSSGGSHGAKEVYQFSNNPANHVYGQGLGLQRGFSVKNGHSNRGGPNANDDHSDGEKVPLAELASPMGMSRQQERQLNGSHFSAPLPPVPAAGGGPKRHDKGANISPEMMGNHAGRTSSGVTSPVSPISHHGGGGLSSNPSFAQRDTFQDGNGNSRHNNMNSLYFAAPGQPPPTQPTPPPQLKVNGHVVYELE